MKQFSSYSELKQDIANDHAERGAQASRYSARVILLDDFKWYQQLVRDLKSRIVELSELMEHENCWFGVNQLCDIVMNQKEDAVVVPVSEVIRFFNDARFDSFLATILLMQNPYKIRVYIPLVGVRTRFLMFWNTFNRKLEGPPVWSLATSSCEQQKIVVYSCKQDIVSDISTINTNKEWLEYWKTNRSTPLITKTQSLIRRWDEFMPNGCFEKDSIESSKDILVKVLFLGFNREYNKTEEAYWNKLLSVCQANDTLKKMFPVQILERLIGIANIMSFDDVSLLQRFLSDDSYNRWLICVLIDQIDRNRSYLRTILTKLCKLDDYSIIHDLYFGVFDDPVKEKIDQRRELIESLPKDYCHLVSMFIGDWFSQLSESAIGIRLCTRYSIEEREYIVLQIAQGKHQDEMSHIYPELAAYLDWSNIECNGSGINDLLVRYFAEYNKAKLLNKTSENYESLFDQLNKSKDSFYQWYYKVPAMNSIDGYKMVQFDGVGAEWLPYILYCISQNSRKYAKEVKLYSLLRVNIPSITQVNKLSDAELIRDFDNTIIHKATGYRYPTSLIEALELVKDMVRKHVMQSPENRICIIADHGASFMCSKSFGAINMHKDLDAQHEGRYYSGAKNLPDNEAFFNAGDYFVAYKHHVISTNVRREVHGGATPEEVLVPCVLVDIMDVYGSKREYSVQISGGTLSYDSKFLQVSVSPNPAESPRFTFNDVELNFKRDLNQFILDLSDFEPGKYTLHTRLDGVDYKESIEISAGYVEEDMFDE
jgi:hypothetical protein